MTEEVLIDFKVDYSELTTAQEQLAKSGKVDTKGFEALNRTIESNAKDSKTLINTFKEVATTASKMGKSVKQAFEQGVTDGLYEAGVSAEEFTDALEKANSPVKSLKSELKKLQEALQQMKVSGTDVGAEFEKIRDRAGVLKDAIADANAEIKNSGSDTKNLDNVVGSISGVVSAFSAAQGAAVLFGDENQDVQKALLKVNAALAISTGLQGLYNATLKEGAITKLIDATRTGAMAAAQTVYTFAVGASTGALKVFRIALLATGIGAIIALLGIAADAMGLFGSSTGETTEDLKAQKEAADALVQSLNDIAGAAANARAAQSGGSDEIKRQIELLKARGASSREIFNAEQAQRQQELQEIRTLGNTYADALNTRRRLGTLTLAEEEALNGKLLETSKAFKDKRNEIVAEGFRFEREEGEKNKKLAKERELSKLNDVVLRIERELLYAQAGSESELILKKKLVEAKANLELAADKITATRKLFITSQMYKDLSKLQEEFNKKLTTEQLQANIDTNNALLASADLTAQQRLQFQIENIQAQAQLEINAAGDNATAILLIEAEKYSKIRALRNEAIEKELQDQLKSEATRQGIIIRSLNKIASDERKSTGSRIEAIHSIAREELKNVDTKEAALKKMNLDTEEYNRRQKALSDERVQIQADESERIADLKKKELEETLQLTFQIAGQVGDFFAGIAALETQRDNERIAQRKRELDALLEAGAITAKEADVRAKQIEILERQAKQRQAQREKNEAVFKAILAIPQAALTGLVQGGPILAAIYGALAAAQAALIIARPVPKFFRGKKDRYEGPGVVGDMGSELVERNGRMFIYTKPTQTYLGAGDKVYTAAETRQILHTTQNAAIVHTNGAQVGIDYDKLGKSIPKQNVNISIHKDFVKESVKEALTETNYFNNKYLYKWQ